MPKYRERLSPAESGLYDLMHESSELLKTLAAESAKDLDRLLHDEDEGTLVTSTPSKSIDYQHDVVTYAFTLGVQFAVNRQQEVAMQVAKQMGLINDPKKSN